MRKFLVLAGVLASATLITGCNPPPQKLVAAPCNCNGNVAVANPDAETPRFTPPGDTAEEHRTVWRGHRNSHHYRTAYRSRHHGYAGSDEQYQREWSTTRVATSSYEYRSTSRVYRASGYASASSASYRSYDDAHRGGFVDVPAHYETDANWRDGYGRSHSSAVHGRALAARMDPWHGYDVDCPEGRR